MMADPSHSPSCDNPAARLFDGLVRERHSCRAFLREPVDQATIEQILETAQRTASWCNSQPWQAVVTTGAETDRFREALYAHASELSWADQRTRPERPDFDFPLRYTGLYKERQRATGWALYDSLGIAFGDREASGRQVLENFRLFGAPHVIIVTTEMELGVYGAIDCGAWIANLMLAAQSRGVATIAQAALAGVADFVRDWFAIAPHRQIICGISLGYADPEHPANRFRTTRAPLDEVVRFVGA